jgi:hypothetical protein
MTIAFLCHYIIVRYILQYTFMLPSASEVVDPGGSLSMLLLSCLKGKMPVEEGIQVGGNSDGDIQ